MTRLIIWLCAFIMLTLVGAVIIDDQRHRDKASLESTHQYRMHESSRVKRTSTNKNIFVTRNFGSKHMCGKTLRPFEVQENMTVEIRTVMVDGLPNILPPDYPIVPNCKVKRS